MIKAAIFDVGGVLIEWSNQYVFDLIIKTFTMSEAEAQSRWSIPIHPFSRGEITEKEFWQEFFGSDAAESSMSNSIFTDAMKNNFTPHNDLLKTVKTLRDRGYPLAIISNTVDPHLNYLKTTGIFEMFDILTFSNEVGFEKPAPEIYEMTLRQLDVDPTEAFFVDDLLVNVVGANELGIHGIQYDNATHVKEQIKKLGVKI